MFPGGIGDAVAWYHRNEESTAFESTMNVQSLESIADKTKDPLIHRTFGGWMAGAGFKAVDSLYACHVIACEVLCAEHSRAVYADPDGARLAR